MVKPASSWGLLCGGQYQLSDIGSQCLGSGAMWAQSKQRSLRQGLRVCCPHSSFARTGKL
jgi:hypothetical protein